MNKKEVIEQLEIKDSKQIEKREKKISDQVKTFSQEEIAIIKNTVAKGTTDLELAYFLNVAKVYGLNPFTKQIWCYKDNKGNVIVFAGRDGFLAISQRNPRWNGICSCEVREGEKFTMNVAMGEISHNKDITSKAKILGAYAICKPKGCEIVTIEWADFDTYNKNYNVWKADPVAMIKKVAESHCMAKAYGISGLAVEEDFDTSSGTAFTINHEEKPDIKNIHYAGKLINTSTYDDEMKDVLEKKIYSPDLTNMEFEQIMNEIQMNQPKKY
jgi:phage recombination protein Bet